MRRVALAAALTGAYGCLTVSEGPIVVGLREMYPDMPDDLESRASGPGITDGTYSAGALPAGFYLPVRGDHCRFETFDRRVASHLSGTLIKVDRIERSPARPVRKIVKSRPPAFAVVSDDDFGPTSYAFSGGCVWRRVGGPDDTTLWLRPQYFDRETWRRMYGR
ncbi:hypothetical protein ACIBF1_23415 [Spirillospora sp. NPDC050679]